jgi:hypothetical protein
MPNFVLLCSFLTDARMLLIILLVCCSMEPSSLDEGHEQDIEERRQKAAFVQQLIMSTIF